MQADWELSQSLTADGTGIRCVAVLPPRVNQQVNTDNNNNSSSSNSNNTDSPERYRLVTGNQGGGLCEFSVPSGDIRAIPFQHDHSVTALLPGRIDGIYITACKDGVVRVLNSETHQITASFRGHEKAVTSLAWCDPKERWLVSGSWDGTAKIWNVENSALVATLPNHENSVCVTGLDYNNGGGEEDSLIIATGSAGMAQGGSIAGHSTRLWRVHVGTGETELLYTVANDHDGPIRDIASYLDNTNDNDSQSKGQSPAVLLATCSNDGSVKIRNSSTGTSMSTLVFVNAEHPPMLLSVTAGDSYIAASAEDGHVVVWQTPGADGALEPQILRHAECVWNVTALPDGDLATCSQDGTLRIFTRSTERVASNEQREAFAVNTEMAVAATRNGPSPNEVAKLHPWERNDEKRGTSEGQIHLFNKNNGTAIAAQWSSISQTWIEVGEVTGKADEGTIDGVQYDHIFPIEVDQTGGGVASLQIGYNNGENPFSAAQRFIDAHMLPQHHLSEIADYISQRAGKQSAVLGPSQQSAAHSTPAAFTGSPIASYEFLPPKAYKAFELTDKVAASTLDKMKIKIEEFGCADTAPISTLMTTLAVSNRYHATTVSSDELSALSELLKNSSATHSFPALDLARLTVLHPDAASSNRSVYWNHVLQRAIDLCNTSDSLEGPAVTAVPMLSLRLFCNAFKGGPGSLEAVVSHLDLILDCIEKHVKSSNKNTRLSIATLLHNVCLYLNREKAGDKFAHKIIPMVNDIVSSKAYESEGIFRALVALGTLVMISPMAKDAANALFLASKVEPAASPHGEQAKAVAKEIYSLLA